MDGNDGKERVLVEWKVTAGVSTGVMGNVGARVKVEAPTSLRVGIP